MLGGDRAPEVAGSGPAVALVFEGGGRAASAVEHDLRHVRHAVALDTLDALVRLRAAGDLDRVVLVTDREDLARRVPDAVAVHDSGGGPFHFGCVLAGLLERLRPRLALVLGGAAAPLYGDADFRRFLALAGSVPGAVVVQNNPQSPDVLAFTGAAAAARLGLPDSDNALGMALSLAGWRRVLVENSARVNFDVDTPTDVAILAGEPQTGPRAAAACADPAWVAAVAAKLAVVEGVLAEEAGELALFGRVGPPVTGYLNMHLRCRLRMFSEERGMRALGREAAGTVVSLVGRCVDAMGAAAFFRLLDGCCDAALFDSRVLMAHWRRPLSDADRFHADIGMADHIGEQRLAAFTAAAFAAVPTVVLGGHSLVYGGLWLLADRVIRRQHPLGS